MKKLPAFIYMLMGSVMNIFSQGPTYVPLGDSYTICEGLTEKERWPNLIVDQLIKEKLIIQLSTNPSRTGFTTDDLIKK